MPQYFYLLDILVIKIHASYNVVEKLNGRLVLSLRDNKTSYNENVRNFRLCFFFNIFPLPNSRSSVWYPCWRKWRCQNRVRQDIWSTWLQCLTVKEIFFPSFSFLSICSFNVMCLQLDYVNFANLIQISGNDLSAKLPLRHSARHVFAQRDAQVTNYFKSSNTRLFFIVCKCY